LSRRATALRPSDDPPPTRPTDARKASRGPASATASSPAACPTSSTKAPTPGAPRPGRSSAAAGTWTGSSLTHAPRRPTTGRPPPDWGTGSPNVWLGVPCGRADPLWRLDPLRRTPAAVQFVSAEPLLGPVDFRPHLGWLGWIITGCEQAARGLRRVRDLGWVR